MTEQFSLYISLKIIKLMIPYAGRRSKEAAKEKLKELK